MLPLWSEVNCVSALRMSQMAIDSLLYGMSEASSTSTQPSAVFEERSSGLSGSGKSAKLNCK